RLHALLKVSLWRAHASGGGLIESIWPGTPRHKARARTTQWHLEVVWITGDSSRHCLSNQSIGKNRSDWRERDRKDESSQIGCRHLRTGYGLGFSQISVRNRDTGPNSRFSR